MRGNRVAVSFDGTWWDTQTREQQLEYIKKHKNTMKKAKPLEFASKFSSKVKTRIGAAGKAASAAYIAALAPKDKADLQTSLIKLDGGQPEKLNPKERSVFKKVGMATAIEMLLVVGAAVALGPVFSPVIASMYLNWKLDGGSLAKKGKDDEPLESDPEDFKLIEPGQRKRVRQLALDYKRPAAEEDEEEDPESDADDDGKAPAPSAEKAEKDAQIEEEKKKEAEKKKRNRQAQITYGLGDDKPTDDNPDEKLKGWPAGTTKFAKKADKEEDKDKPKKEPDPNEGTPKGTPPAEEDGSRPRKPEKVKAEIVDDKDAKPRPRRFANKAAKELTDSEMGDAIVADFQQWLDSEEPEKLADKARADRAKRRAAEKAEKTGKPVPKAKDLKAKPRKPRKAEVAKKMRGTVAQEAEDPIEAKEPPKKRRGAIKPTAKTAAKKVAAKKAPAKKKGSK